MPSVGNYGNVNEYMVYNHLDLPVEKATLTTGKIAG